jgi:hypothetical protein
LRVALPWLIDHVEETWRVLGKDFWAYGLEPNRPTFEAVGRYVHEQGLSPRVSARMSCFCRAWRTPKLPERLAHEARALEPVAPGMVRSLGDADARPTAISASSVRPSSSNGGWSSASRYARR